MTIQVPTIDELRYVNGEPDPNQRPDQQRLSWAKNGEASTGASSDTTSDGVLNRAPVQIQENAVTLHNNTKKQQNTIVELTEAVNLLTGGDDADFGERLNVAEADIDALEVTTADLVTKVGNAADNSDPEVPLPATGLYKHIEDIKVDVGVRNPLDVANPIAKNDAVRDDLFFVKQRLGNQRGYDWNGNVIENNPPTGIYLNVEDLFQRTTDNTNSIGADDAVGTVKGRITELEQNSSIGDVTDIREEIGLRNDRDPTRDIYARLDEDESLLEDYGIDITSLQTIVSAPTTGLVDVVASHTTTINDMGIALTGNIDNVNNINTDIGVYDGGDIYIGTIKARLSGFNTEITDLWSRVGVDDIASGTLGYRITQLEADVGEKASPVNGTVWYDLNAATNALPVLDGRVDDLEESLGLHDSEPGTVRYRVSTLEGMIGNGSVAGDGFLLDDESSIRFDLNSVDLPVLTASHTSAAVSVGTATYELELIGTDVTFEGVALPKEAPNDGNEYVRKNNGWSLNSSASPANGFDLINTAAIQYENSTTGTRNVISGDVDVTVFGEDGYTARIDGVLSGITLANDISVVGKTTGGADYNMVSVTASDVLRIGENTNALPLSIRTSTNDDFTVTFADDPGNPHTIVHSGNVYDYSPDEVLDDGKLYARQHGLWVEVPAPATYESASISIDAYSGTALNITSTPLNPFVPLSTQNTKLDNYTWDGTIATETALYGGERNIEVSLDMFYDDTEPTNSVDILIVHTPSGGSAVTETFSRTLRKGLTQHLSIRTTIPMETGDTLHVELSRGAAVADYLLQVDSMQLTII